MNKLTKFKKNDFVTFDYEGDKFNAKVLDILPEGYLITICIDTLNDKRLMQELVVPEHKLSHVTINLA